MVWMVLLACAKQAPVEPSRSDDAPLERAHAHKAGAPVTLDANVGADASQVEVTFAGASSDVQILAWGASGLQVQGERLRWEGPAKEGETVQLDLGHAGAGDLAVRVVGTFGGERLDEVRSWTVGDRKPTQVPVQHGAKGWDATRR